MRRPRRRCGVPAARTASRPARLRASGATMRSAREGGSELTATRIGVGGGRPDPVVVGTAVLGELPALVGEAARTVVVIGPDGLEAIARPVRRALESAGYLVHAETVPAGEAAKQISVAARLWSRLAAQGVTRRDAIGGGGGGAATRPAGLLGARRR